MGVLSRANLLYLLISLLPLTLSILISVKRWQTIIGAMGYSMPSTRCFNVLMASTPLASVTPMKLGDTVRSYYLRNEIPPTRVIGSVLTERIFDLFILVSLSLMGVIIYQKFEFTFIVLGALVFLTVLVFVLHTDLRFSVMKSWVKKLEGITFSMKALTKNKKTFFTVMLHSLAYWVLGVVQVLFFFYALGINVPPLFVVTYIPIAIFIGLIPVTVGGMGTRDAAIIFLFSDFAALEKLLGVGILFSIFRYWLLSLAGIPFMHKMLRSRK